MFLQVFVFSEMYVIAGNSSPLVLCLCLYCSSDAVSVWLYLSASGTTIGCSNLVERDNMLHSHFFVSPVPSTQQMFSKCFENLL